MEDIEKLALIQNEEIIWTKLAKIDSLDYYVRTELMQIIN